MESTFSSLCSCSDSFSLPRQGAAHANVDSLPPHDLVIRTDGSVPLSFGKGGSGVLSHCGSEATLSFSAGPVCSSFPLKSAPFCKLFAGLGSNNKSAIIFSFPTLALPSPLCPLLCLSLYLYHSGRSAETNFSFLLYYPGTMGPQTLVSPMENAAN